MSESIASQNAVIPGGRLALGVRQLRVRTSGEYPHVDELRRTILSSSDLVFLQDVGTVSFGYEDPRYQTRFDGEQCVFVSFTQKGDVNVVRG